MRKVSELLRETRERKYITLNTIEKETKIKKEFLEAIERGNFNRLPSESYALGFVKNYAKYLGLPLPTVVPLFRREYSQKMHVSIIPEFRKTQHKFNKKFIFSPQGFAIIFAIIIVIAYIFYQYSSLIFAPSLSVENPKNSQVVSGNVVEVKGKTDPYATVYIDKEEVYVGLDGSFKKSVYQFSGDAKITVTAKNRFGKESKKVINVRVE
jgi:cytoskeletal protein RodZ